MLKEILISTFNAESAVTQKLIERMPETQLDYKPHEKSASVLRLAAHTVSLAKFIPTCLTEPSLNFMAFKSTFAPPMTKSELIECFHYYDDKAKEALANVDESALLQPFKVLAGEHIVSEKNRFDEIQSLIRHTVHHRGQLSVYLRLFNIPLPNMYGPSADER